ncbi:metallophosphoesterase [Beutenbergia cavernae DSM 12333]|uniref:Metallophosphoesterase n=1 Tax=Beutenbergia cavernae (strain ATCC BAA-8 / DSM 12333 / CCUG 43141 / JCM 11478 / NBRC 16432 / NCIMB 13614 / HKI 0122) TaxID=471853 RepID=C5C458_BEUC1|nr:metallophosphoesterase [Beutenbergia cavernae]ACQ79971.1 metallophosphoesterase [Beutenbergia cavernae DSM 12333]
MSAAPPESAGPDAGTAEHPRWTRWWHARTPTFRRTTRQVLAVLVTGVLAAVVGVATATATGSLGPHEAQYSVTARHDIVIDLGPLGSVVLDSPAPWPVGARVDVGEIPSSLTDVRSPLDQLGGDVTGYAQFFSHPQVAIEAAAWAVVADAVRRTVLLWSVLLVAIAAARLASRGLLRREIVAAMRRPGVGALAGTLAATALAVPVVGWLSEPEPEGSPSAVFAGTALEDARVTGRLAAVIDTYGSLALDAIEDNDEFYRVVRDNLVEAYAVDAEPLAPDVEPVPDDPGEQDPPATPSDAPSGTAPDADADAAEDGEPDVATILMVSDLHCNVGMAPVIAEAVRQSGATLVLNLGDTTMGGSGVEAMCVDALAEAIDGEVPIVVADGNHDSALTMEQERAAGEILLDGDVLEIQGIRILGDRDPRLTTITDREEFETKAEMGERLGDVACAAQEDDAAVDLLAIHDPYVGAGVMETGCVPLQLSGHLHRRVGPLQQGLGVLYVMPSTGGASSGTLTIGPLNAPATMTVLRFDRTTRTAVAMREITAATTGDVVLGAWEGFPPRPDDVVVADLAPSAQD